MDNDLQLDPKRIGPNFDPIREVSSGMRFLLSAIGSSVMMGAIFWAGATYNRVAAIEVRLGNMETQLARIGDIAALSERTTETQKRLEKLEDYQRRTH